MTDRDARLVLGDELQARGDPLGELIAVQAKLEDAPRDETLRERERAIVLENEAAWFGELAPEMHRLRRVEYGWRLGELESVVLRTVHPVFLRALTTSPVAQSLSRILIDLRDVEVADVSLTPIAAPRLERFELRAHPLMVGTYDLVGETAAKWRRLRRVEIWSSQTDDVYSLETLLDGGELEHIEHLAIHRLPGNRALQTVGGSELLPKLKSLDVSHGRASAMDQFDRYRHLERLNLHDNCFHPDAAKAIKGYLGDRVEIGHQYSPTDTSRHSLYAEIVRTESPARILAELATPEAIPFLLKNLDADIERQEWVIAALEHLGPAAGPDASDALAQRRMYATLEKVDPERHAALRK